MSRWQITKEVHDPQDEFVPAVDEVPPDAVFDDGQTNNPGDDGWNTDAVNAELQSLQDQYGVCFGANYLPPST